MSGVSVQFPVTHNTNSNLANVDWDNPYFDMIHKEWGASLRKVFNALPDPDWARWPAEDPAPTPRIGVVS